MICESKNRHIKLRFFFKKKGTTSTLYACYGPRSGGLSALILSVELQHLWAVHPTATTPYNAALLVRVRIMDAGVRRRRSMLTLPWTCCFKIFCSHRLLLWMNVCDAWSPAGLTYSLNQLLNGFDYFTLWKKNSVTVSRQPELKFVLCESKQADAVP